MGRLRIDRKKTMSSFCRSDVSSEVEEVKRGTKAKHGMGVFGVVCHDFVTHLTCMKQKEMY